MQVPPIVLVVAIVIIGFLTGSTAYFYSRSRVATATKTQQSTAFDGQVSAEPTTTPDPIDQLAQPADPKGRLSYPANAYTIQPKEALAAIAGKMGLSWQQIKLANGFANENVVQAGSVIVIPKLNHKTDYYRVNFLINDDKATQLNIDLRSETTSDYYDPIAVSKKYGPPYYGIKADGTFTLLEEDKSKGTAVVRNKIDDSTSNLIGLVQPKTTGDKGLWAILYIEHQDTNAN